MEEQVHLLVLTWAVYLKVTLVATGADILANIRSWEVIYTSRSAAWHELWVQRHCWYYTVFIPV